MKKVWKQSLVRKMDLKFMKEKVPDIKAWHTVRVKQIIKEWDKKMTQIFEWLVIKVHKAWLKTTITVRKVSDWIWVEKVFPVHSPMVESIEIIKVAKIRRAKLYYMRDRFGKSARLKERQTTPWEREKMMITYDIPKNEVKEENKEEQAS